MLKNLKYKLQRIYRGYSDEDTKNVNRFIVEKLQPIIKKYVTFEAEQGRTLPKGFTSDPAAWLNILREVEFAFDETYKDLLGEGHTIYSEDDESKRKERIEEGFRLFGQWCRELKS